MGVLHDGQGCIGGLRSLKPQESKEECDNDDGSDEVVDDTTG